MKLKTLLLFLLFAVSAHSSFAQTLPVGLLDNTDDLFRRQQLLGKDTSSSSFMIRPLFLSERNNLNLSEDPAGRLLKDWNRLLWTNTKGNMEVRALPVVWQQQINAHHPYGWNDGAMIPAKGYQTSISGGLFAKIGALSIQLRPEYVYAANPAFKENLDENNPASLQSAIKHYHTYIDNPERFGSDTFSELNWGQSSIRLNFDPVSIGLSNENLWWGPGVRNSLLMGNNAPGFKHITLNTTRPVKTPVGSFEAQLVAGKLENSGVERTDMGFTPKLNSWRYFSGVVFSYQPKWVPGLFLGFDRSFTIYRSQMGSGLGDYLAVITPFTKKSYNNDDNTINAEDGRPRDQIFSLFARWLMPESNSEIYLQYGKEDHSWDSRDAFVEADHSRAYVAGFRKLIPLNRSEEYIQAGIELTQTEPSGIKDVRNQGTWYSHSQVRHGYTNKGQIMGAGIGPDNMQSINVDWVKGLKRIGMVMERRVHNNNLYYRAFAASKDFRRHWVDFGLGGKFDWEINKFVLNSQLVYIKSLNYHYQFENQSPSSIFIWDKQDVSNLHFRVGLMYRW